MPVCIVSNPAIPVLRLVPLFSEEGMPGDVVVRIYPTLRAAQTALHRRRLMDRTPDRSLDRTCDLMAS